MTHLQKPVPHRVVMVVDDQAGVRHLARRILESAGYGVIEADDGRVALDMITAGASDLNAHDWRFRA